MIYKSRHHDDDTLKLGMAVAPSPSSPVKRLTGEPIFNFSNPNTHVEDPYFWYDKKKKLFCILAKDDSKNGDTSLTGEWGAGFFASSKDAKSFTIEKDSKVYSRTIKWEEGKITTQGNLERISLLLNEEGEPYYVYFASGPSSNPYSFKLPTYIIGMEVKKKEE